MFNSAQFHLYRTGESVQFFNDLVSLCKRSNPESLNLTKQVKDLEQKAEELNNNFKPDKGSEITAKLTELDQRRDKAYMCLNTLAEGYAYHMDESKVAAANNILFIFDKYGSGLTRLNYQAETSLMANLGEELQSKAAKALTTLNLADVTTEMMEANTAFNQKFLDRIEESAEGDTEALGNLIKDAIESYRIFTSFLGAHATLNPSEAYTSLINQVNELIDGYNTTVLQRKTKEEEVS